jgi:purine-binding chemotaxis protein CheW
MTTAAVETAVRACLFTLGPETFAVDAHRVREVVVLDEVTPVPLAPSHLVGVANLRGEVVALVEARHLLGLPPRPAGHALRALVLAGDGGPVALIIDDVVGLDTFDEITPLADGARGRPGPWTRGLLRRGERAATWLDADILVAALRPAAEGRRPEA